MHFIQFVLYYTAVCNRLYSGAPIDIFSDPGFAFFHKVLHAEMKELEAKGIGLKLKQAEPISNSNENRLWQEGLLGDATPNVLLDAMVFLWSVLYVKKWCGASVPQLVLNEWSCLCRIYRTWFQE